MRLLDRKKRLTFRVNLINNFELCSRTVARALLFPNDGAVRGLALQQQANRMTPLSRDDFATVSDPVYLFEKKKNLD